MNADTQQRHTDACSTENETHNKQNDSYYQRQIDTHLASGRSATLQTKHTCSIQFYFLISSNFTEDYDYKLLNID